MMGSGIFIICFHCSKSGCQDRADPFFSFVVLFVRACEFIFKHQSELRSIGRIT